MRRGLARWAALREYPIIPCNLCGSQVNLQRVKVGQMLRDWEREQPGRIDRIFRAMSHVDASHLMDRNLYPFASLQPGGVADAAGDRAFDDDDAIDSCAVEPRAEGAAAIDIASLRSPWVEPSPRGDEP